MILISHGSAVGYFLFLKRGKCVIIIVKGGETVEEKKRCYIAIDLKSFYASVECVERGLDPMRANLVVADRSRTEKTICLAVSPGLKRYGIPGRARLFEVIEELKRVNADRLSRAPGRRFSGKSTDSVELDRDLSLEADFITAVPRMALYIDYSTRIYSVYLRYIAPEDIHTYSIDEVFIDATDYLKCYSLSPREFARLLIKEVLKETGVTAAAGIGDNLYLCKVAMDITAKHIPPDEDGVRIAELDEKSYRETLWDHRPLTDFWRIGRGIASKLEQHRLYTMGDVARCSTYNEELLYKLFGVNAELLIDHAWGYESCTMRDIKAYRPSVNSLSSGQVLKTPYSHGKARLVVKEMAESLSLDLVEKRLVVHKLTLYVGYDIENISRGYAGEIKKDYYGRKVPEQGRGSVNLVTPTSSGKKIVESVLKLFEEITDEELLIRRVNLTAENVVPEDSVSGNITAEQIDIFTDISALEKKREEEENELKRERRRQDAVIGIKKKFGKNAIIMGSDLEEGATAIERNNEIGGHKA